MRVLELIVIAVLLGIGAAWCAARYEFQGPENPLAGIVEETPSADAAPVPQAVADGPETFDFGTMELGGTQSHVFHIKNAGTAPLQLTKGHTSCKCTISDVAESPLPPGQSREVKLEWTPKEATETFVQSAQILTNDPQRSQLTFSIRGRVLESVKIEPKAISLNQISAHEPITQEVRLWTYRTQPLEIKSWEFAETSTAPHFDLLVKEMPAEVVAEERDAKAGKLLTIAMKPGLPIGSLQQTLRLQLNYAEHPQTEVTLSGRVIGDISLVGGTVDRERGFINLGSASRTKGMKSSLFVVVKGPQRDDVKLKLLSVSPNDSLQVELGEPKASGGKSVLWPLTIQIPIDAETVSRLGPAVEDFGEIVLETTHPESPRYSIRVRFAVTEE